MEPRKPQSPSWSREAWKATVVALALAIAYPMSYGPAAWLWRRGHLATVSLNMYAPVWIMMDSAPKPVQSAWLMYLHWFSSPIPVPPAGAPKMIVR